METLINLMRRGGGKKTGSKSVKNSMALITKPSQDDVTTA